MIPCATKSIFFLLPIDNKKLKVFKLIQFECDWWTRKWTLWGFACVVLFCFLSFISQNSNCKYETHTRSHISCFELYSSWRSCQNEVCKTFNKTCCNQIFRDIVVYRKWNEKKRNKQSQQVLKLICMQCKDWWRTSHNKNCISHFKCFVRWNWGANFTGVNTCILWCCQCCPTTHV